MEDDRVKITKLDLEGTVGMTADDLGRFSKVKQALFCFRAVAAFAVRRSTQSPKATPGPNEILIK